MKMKLPSGSKNTNPNKPNFKPDDGFSAYYTRDCQGPPGYGEGLCRDESGLAMTFLGAFLPSQSISRVFNTLDWNLPLFDLDKGLGRMQMTEKGSQNFEFTLAPRVVHFVNGLNKTGVKFHWQDGRIVPNVDEEVIEQIDRITEELMAEGQVSTGLATAKKTEADPNQPAGIAETQATTEEAQGKILSESRSFPMLVFVLIGLSIIAIIAWRVFLLKGR